MVTVVETVATDDVLRDVRRLLARIGTGDPEVRAQLGALALEHRAWDEVIALVEDEVRRATVPAVAAAYLRELSELQLAGGRANEAEGAIRRWRAAASADDVKKDEAALYARLADVYERELDQPFDALTAIERLVQLVPGSAALHERVARLSVKVGAWDGAVIALERAAEATSEEARAHADLAAAAGYAAERLTAARAIELYRRIVKRWPDDREAWRALETLYEREERWRDLAEARRALAGLASEPWARAELLHGQARALLAAGSAAAAAVLHAEAAELAPESPAALVERTVALAAAGHGREAAELLAARLAKDPHADPRLRLRHAELTADVLGERALALALVEGVLGDEPGHQGALALLVHLADGEGAATAAAARVRLAETLPAGPARTALLLAAARRLRDDGHDVGATIAAYLRVLDQEPDHAAAEAELAALRAGLDVERVLARVRAELEAGRAADAWLTADAALERFADAPAEARGRLYHGAARAKAALGEADEAHRFLIEAHRLRKGDLSLTLALGKSAFARRLWHEAALHLSALATHPKAAEHATEVAEALVLAAQAETRALRPERAEGHYLRAVALDPRATAAWHGLGEIAMQRGEVARAADCLEKEAAASTDARDRLRLWDALGDLADSVLGDPARAERCWLEAARSVAPEAKHGPLYDKLLALLRARPAGAELGEVAELASAAHHDAAARRAFALEAAAAFGAAGQPARARAVAARLADALPLDDEAVAVAARLELELGDHEAAAARLGRALNAWDAAEKGQGPPTGAAALARAGLWLCLGDARRGRGDLRGAESAWQRALALVPPGDAGGAVASGARRGLVFAAARAGRPAIDHLRLLVEAEQRPDEVLELAAELAVASDSGRASVAEARAMFELAEALGRPGGDLGERFASRHPARAMASDEAYAGALDEAERRALVDDADDEPLAGVMALLWESAALVAPDAKHALDKAGYPDAERVSPTSPMAAPALYPQVSKALGGGMTLLYATTQGAAPELTLLAASPPVVLLGGALASRRASSVRDAEVEADAELRFRLGRVVELARPARVLASGLSAARFAELVGGLLHAFGPSPRADVDAGVASMADKLRAALPLMLRTRLGERLAAAPPELLDPARYHAACTRAADRAGLVVTSHLGVAIARAGGPAAAAHLVRLAASTRFLAARKKLRERAP